MKGSHLNRLARLSPKTGSAFELHDFASDSRSDDELAREGWRVPGWEIYGQIDGQRRLFNRFCSRHTPRVA
jgi:hypothetical protein